jgi:hypothetical protein
MFRSVSPPTRPHSARRAESDYNRQRALLPKDFFRAAITELGCDAKSASETPPTVFLDATGK